jgi:hypothetical protein
VPFHKWEAALSGFQWTNIGTRSSHYPSDTYTLIRWTESLRKWVVENRQPIHGHLQVHELSALADCITKTA